jgi:subtilisin-like proprotein convertase family protein
VQQEFTPIINTDVPAGDWTLTVIDRKTGHHGTLKKWSLGVNREAPLMLAPGERPKPTEKH